MCRRLFGGGEGRGLRCGDYRGGFLGDARSLEKARILRAHSRTALAKVKFAEIVGGDVAVFDSS
jgi:hypothetical protein